eukprot:TRINITY_DN7903_c0_g1_i1.p1 TRINITY_DN7903_c0_g1~~TRINITY_DN7903_c0_g1_i1.p1  ORF type:complete len:225 (+),score=30.90 TRINITY_DN7903_c0_g1_i1:60-677(+)
MNYKQIVPTVIDELLSYNNSDAWKTTHNVMGRQGYSMNVDFSNIKMFKAVDSISFEDISAEDAFYAVWKISEEDWKMLDPDVMLWDVLEEISEDIRIVMQISKLPWPLWDRASVMIATREYVDGKYIIAYKSIEDERFPVNKKKFVRCMVNVSGFIFEENGDGCTVTRIMQIDPNGNVPSSIVNSLSSNLYMFGSDLRPLIERNL